MRNRSVDIAVLSLLALFPVLPAAASQGDKVTWFLFDGAPGVPLAEGMIEVPCGDYGRFAVLKGELPWAARAKGGPGCAYSKATVCGSEIPPLYPSPPLPKELEPPLVAGTKTGVWIPCEGGRCFEDAAGITASTPWVAVIDWHNLHGWSIGWTISHLAGVRTVLFPLYDRPLGPFSRLGATDLHVLAKLCEVAEIADHRAAPPLVINLSLGRLYRKDDPKAAATCKSDALSCQIARVLRHLACPASLCGEEERPQAPRTLAVAAAGNYRQPQFPAALPAVLAAGSLQIGRYRSERVVEASWETPRYDKGQAWMPGYGLCLGEGDGEDWPAPPGTSYAAAFFSGWLASKTSPSLVSDPLSDDSWIPALEGGSFYLVHGEERWQAGPAVQKLLKRNLLAPSRACSTPGPESAAPYLLRGAAVPSPVKVLPSFLEVLDKLASDFKRPAPTDRPCVPCIGIDPSPPTDRRQKDSGVLVIDRRGSTQAGPSGPPDFGANDDLVPQELYLRRGNQFLRLRPEDGEGLPLVADPGVQRFAIAGVQVPPGEQPSLIYVYEADEIRFWSSVPVFVSP